MRAELTETQRTALLMGASALHLQADVARAHAIAYSSTDVTRIYSDLANERIRQAEVLRELAEAHCQPPLSSARG